MRQTIFDELEMMTSHILREVEGESPQQRADRVCDEVLDMLIDLYLLGWAEVSEDTQPSADEMRASVYEPIAGQTWEQRIRDYVLHDGSVGEIARVIDTDSHRVLNQGIYDSADQLQREQGVRLNKKWVTMKDNRVRDSHDYLDGVTIPLHDRFYTYTGASALHPGGFGQADEDVNCRCVLQITPME